MIKVVIKVIVLRKSMALNRGNIIMKRITNQTNFKKQKIIEKMIIVQKNLSMIGGPINWKLNLPRGQNLSMIGKIKQIEQIGLINLSMIGKINNLIVGKEVIVVIVTIRMISINTIDKIKEMKYQKIKKNQSTKIIKIKC